MRRILFTILLCLPLIAAAQNTWEMSENVQNAAKSPDSKYLAGAVPVTDGKVTFRTTIDAPGKSAEQIYRIIQKYMADMVHEPNQLNKSRVVINDSIKHELCGLYEEWLVFKSTTLVLDRTRLQYNLFVNCYDGKADVRMTRIHYLYEEERDPQTYDAEEWITDEYGLRKDKSRLARMSGKFRRKTIDRKDYLFNKLTGLLK